MPELTIWWCSLCREDVQIGQKPAECSGCHSDESLRSQGVPYAPTQITNDYVVDLKRHYDGEDGLVGPFTTRETAEVFIAALPDRFIRDYATIRPIAPF